MERSQFLEMTKAELNVALTPYMGGYTPSNLKRASKEELVDKLMEFHLRDSGKAPKKPGSGKASPVDHYEILKEIESDQRVLKSRFNPKEKYISIKLVKTGKSFDLRARRDGTFTLYSLKNKTMPFATLNDALNYEGE